MIASRFNFFVEQDSGSCLAYNARTNALAMLDEAKWKAYSRFMDGASSHAELPDIADWIRGGFIVDDAIQEQNMIRYGMWRSRFSTQSYSLTIAPTLGCNFRCVYCYEKAAEVTLGMKQDVQNAIVHSLESRLATISEFSVVWYGGEPLLAFDIIKSLSTRFIKICDEAKVEYSASIVTNGYLLTPEIAKELVALKVTGAQITLDGTKDVHDKRRPLADGGPSFDRIIERITGCAELLPISLRVNIDRNNIAMNDALLEQLLEKKLGDKVGVYLGWVEPSNGCYDDSTCLTLADFSEEKLRFAQKLLDMGFHYDAMSDYPHRRHNICGADAFMADVIAPNGDIYACWSDIGIEGFRMGSITDPLIRGNHDRFYDYMLYDPTLDPDCVECAYLPICMGGCPKRRIDKNAERCTHVKSNLNKYLTNAAAMILEKREKEKISSACPSGDCNSSELCGCDKETIVEKA